jgi:predicted dinucleotide-utilizing enzyme
VVLVIVEVVKLVVVSLKALETDETMPEDVGVPLVLESVVVLLSGAVVGLELELDVVDDAIEDVEETIRQEQAELTALGLLPQFSR